MDASPQQDSLRALTECAAKLAVLAEQLPLLERLLDEEQQFLIVEWLADVVIGAFPHGLDRGFGCGEGGDQDDLGSRPLRPRGAEDIEAAAMPKLHVGDDEIDLVGSEPRDRLR